MMDWKIGQRVTILRGDWHQPTAIRTIKKISNRVTLNDGTQWNAKDGRSWGSGSSYHAACIRPVEEGDVETIVMMRLRQDIRDVDWQADYLSRSDLERVLEIVSDARNR